MSNTDQFDDLQFLTVAEVSLILRVSRMTVYRMINAGELDCRPVGRSKRVPSLALRKYLHMDDEVPAGSPDPLVG